MTVFLFNCPMLNLHDRINYVDVFKNKVSLVLSLEENCSWSHHPTAIGYVLRCVKPAAGELWTSTLGSYIASEGRAADGLWVVSSRGQLWLP